MEKMNKQQAVVLRDKIFMQFGITLEISQPFYEHRIHEADREYCSLIVYYGPEDKWGMQSCLVIDNELQWDHFKALVVDIAQRISDYSQSVFEEKERNFEKEAHEATYQNPDD